ncbi:MAG: tRNA uridine-5-carboxymethylaminomethyl(34) synthesis GTPase MnmE [Beijerinckiaceae bacterium]
MTETIFSLSSAYGRAGIAVIRMSGPASDATGLAIAGCLPVPRMATLVSLREPGTGVLLDKALVLRFLDGVSFTGEASWEFHVHGGRAVVKAVLDCLAAQPGLRLAEAGEFTRRSLENGKLDLTQVEALADLIDADTEHQRLLALQGLEGALGLAARDWRKIIKDIKSLIAADIDFSDEGDVGDRATNDIDSLLKQLQEHFKAALASGRAGRIVSEGFRIALIGATNVGKSTLLNALAGSEVAIVTEYAGTTRDILEVKIDLDGFFVVVQDMAGFRETEDVVEKIGISRAYAAAERADLLLILDDGNQKVPELPASLKTIKSIHIRSKSDLGAKINSEGDVAISAKTGEGLVQMRRLILAELGAMVQPHEASIITRERQRLAIEHALDFCLLARTTLPRGIEFVAENVQRMDQALANLLGLVGIEEVLGAVFSRFCIGK